MRRSPLHTNITPPHDARLARVETELEFPLEHDAKVNGHGAVERGLEAGAEVDEAEDGAVGDVQAWLEGC